MEPLSASAQIGLDLIGQSIATQPSELLDLLRETGWQIDPGTDPPALLGIVLESLEKGGEQFEKAFVRLISAESSFNGEAASMNIGADPVSAIAGAVGSVADMVRSVSNRKQLKRQAQAATFQALMQPPNQVRFSPSPVVIPPRKRPIWPWLLGGGIVLLGGLFTIYHFTQTH